MPVSTVVTWGLDFELWSVKLRNLTRFHIIQRDFALYERSPPTGVKFGARLLSILDGDKHFPLRKQKRKHWGIPIFKTHVYILINVKQGLVKGSMSKQWLKK